MTVYDHGVNLLTRHYLGECYELDETPSSTTEKLYLCGDYYDATAVLVKDENSEGVYQIVRDVIGSITCVIAPDGSSRTMSYDAWGRLRNPDTFEVYERGEEPELFLGRGFTGHEHLPYFGLINMNARLYDPEVGRFLSPDPNVQNPELPQNFNRYTYAMNNPLCYVDKDGEFWWLVAAAVAGAYIGGVVSNHGELNPFAWNYKSVSTYLGMATGGLVGVAAVSSGFGFAGALTTPYVSAGVAVSAAGAGTGWHYDFHWSTVAGGGGGIRNYSMDPSPAVDEAIAEASWNFQAFQHATAVSLVLVSDDITGIGAVDDILIPFAYGAATLCFLYDNAQLVAKRDKEIEGIRNRNYSPRQGVTYALVVTKDGYYTDVRNNKIYLHTGDVWKYGETLNPHDRYPKSYYDNNNLEMVKLFYGNQMEIKIQEKMYIYGYFFKHGELPPGNKIFR